MSIGRLRPLVKLVGKDSIYSPFANYKFNHLSPHAGQLRNHAEVALSGRGAGFPPSPASRFAEPRIKTHSMFSLEPYIKTYKYYFDSLYYGLIKPADIQSLVDFNELKDQSEDEIKEYLDSWIVRTDQIHGGTSEAKIYLNKTLDQDNTTRYSLVFEGVLRPMKVSLPDQFDAHWMGRLAKRMGVTNESDLRKGDYFYTSMPLTNEEDPFPSHISPFVGLYVLGNNFVENDRKIDMEQYTREQIERIGLTHSDAELFNRWMDRRIFRKQVYEYLNENIDAPLPPQFYHFRKYLKKKRYLEKIKNEMNTTTQPVNTDKQNEKNIEDDYEDENPEEVIPYKDENGKYVYGFASLISPTFEFPNFNTFHYQFISMNVKTDGRGYLFHTRAHEDERFDSFSARISPEIPRGFAKREIELESLTGVQKGNKLNWTKRKKILKSFGFSLQGSPGPFRLEFEFVRMHRNQLPEYRVKDILRRSPDISYDFATHELGFKVNERTYLDILKNAESIKARAKTKGQ